MSSFLLDDTQVMVYDKILCGSTFKVREVDIPDGYHMSVTVGGKSMAAGEDGWVIITATEDVEIVFTNHTGPELPETGGMGTHIYTSLGTVMVLGAGVLLLNQRRRKEADSVT